MELIEAGMGALEEPLSINGKSFSVCEAMDKEVMVAKGQKRVSGDHPIQRETTILFPTDQVLPLPMDSA